MHLVSFLAPSCSEASIIVVDIEPASFMDRVSLRTGKTDPNGDSPVINAKESQESDFSQDDSGWDDN